MKIIKISSKRTRALARHILGDKYEEGLWENLLKLDVTPTQKDLPELSRFVKEFPFSEVVKYYRLFNNSKIREKSLDQFKGFESFVDAVNQSPSNLTKYWDELNEMDVTVSKMHVNDLLRLMKDGGMSIHQMEYYYRTYAGSDLSLEKPLSSYATFNDFEQDIDALGGVAGNDMSDEVVPPIYTDENVKVYLGDTKNKCVELSKGYTFCIGRTDTSNLYANYRVRDRTFYFIRFSKNNDYIVIHVLPNDEYMYTMSFNDGDRNITKEQLIDKYPDIAVLFENGILERKPLTELEKMTLRVADDVTFQGFDYSTKTAYISAGHELSDVQFDLIDKDQKNLYINSLNGILSREQFLKIQSTPLGNRYIVLVKRKIENDTFLFNRLPDVIQQDERMNDVMSMIKTGWINEMEKNINNPAYCVGDIASLIPKKLLSDPDIIKAMKEWIIREAKENPDMSYGGGFLLIPITIPEQLKDDEEEIYNARMEGYKKRLIKDPRSYGTMNESFRTSPELKETAISSFVDRLNDVYNKLYNMKNDTPDIDLMKQEITMEIFLIPSQLQDEPRIKEVVDKVKELTHPLEEVQATTWYSFYKKGLN